MVAIPSASNDILQLSYGKIKIDLKDLFGIFRIANGQLLTFNLLNHHCRPIGQNL